MTVIRYGWGVVALACVLVSLGLGAAALVLLALIFIIRAAKPTLIPTPTAYATYTSLDRSFTCDEPAGWSKGEAGGDGGNAAGVYFKSGAARIDVDGSLTGSLAGDMMRAANALLPENRQRPPVEGLHLAGVNHMSEKYGDYDEQPMQTIQTQLGEGRISEWTGTGGVMAGKLHGYRVTVLGGERLFTMNCRCPQRNWKVLEPSFMRVIHSVAAGSG